MDGIVTKIKDAFDDSGAKSQVKRKYTYLEDMHEHLRMNLHKLKCCSYEALTGLTQEEIEQQIQIYERRLYVIGEKLDELRKSIGGNY